MVGKIINTESPTLNSFPPEFQTVIFRSTAEIVGRNRLVNSIQILCDPWVLLKERFTSGQQTVRAAVRFKDVGQIGFEILVGDVGPDVAPDGSTFSITDMKNDWFHLEKPATN